MLLCTRRSAESLSGVYASDGPRRTQSRSPCSSPCSPARRPCSSRLVLPGSVSDDSNDSDDSDEEDEDDEDEDDGDEIVIHETEDPLNKTSKKITANMVIEAMKKKGYNETDFITLIMIESARTKFKKETIKRSNDMTDYLYKILDNEISLDYRDSRTYASVVNGLQQTHPRGKGPTPIKIELVVD